MASRPFKELFAIPLRNGLTKPKAVRGAGTKMVNMGELFANPRIVNVAMDRVPLNQAERSSSLLAAGDLLFARQSLVLSGAGKCSIFVRDDENVCFESHVIRCRVSQELADPHFYYYFFSSPAGRALMESIVEQGAGASGIRGSDLAELSVPWIDPIFQRRVAGVLSQIDDKISFNRRIIQTLEAMAQAIFQSWFVDFDPVKAKIAAKAEGRDPLRAAMSAISGKADAELDALPPEQYEQLAATAALFPDEMEASNLGQIPKGWAINQISQFGDVVCGKTPSKTNPDFFGEGIPFIKIPDMHNNVYVVSPLEQLSASGAASQVKKTIPPGSICVSCIATVGKVVIAHEPSQTNQQINSIVPRHPQYTTYLYFQMRAKDKEFHDLASGGSATLNMNTSTFSKVSVLNPAFNVLEKFSVNVEPLFSEILVRQKQSALLSEARDTLLPKLLSGELSVADAMVEAVA